MNPGFLQIYKSNKKIGLGHVMRSLSLYSKIKQSNKKVVFLYFGSSKNAISIIKKNVSSNKIVFSEKEDIVNEIINENTTIILDMPENQKISFDNNIKSRNVIVVFDFLKDFDFKKKYFLPQYQT